jgi:hypothetical protein
MATTSRAEVELEALVSRSAARTASIPEALRMAIGLCRDLQATCMGGDRVQAVLEALDSALDAARELGIRQ